MFKFELNEKVLITSNKAPFNTGVILGRKQLNSPINEYLVRITNTSFEGESYISPFKIFDDAVANWRRRHRNRGMFIKENNIQKLKNKLELDGEY